MAGRQGACHPAVPTCLAVNLVSTLTQTPWGSSRRLSFQACTFQQSCSNSENTSGNSVSDSYPKLLMPTLQQKAWRGSGNQYVHSPEHEENDGTGKVNRVILVLSSAFLFIVAI